MNETIEHIVAEMRRDCPARHMDGTMYREGDWVYTKGTVKKLADRIEAAWKAERERAKADALVVGGMVEAVRREKLGMPAKVVHRVDADKQMDEIRERVQWMIDRLDSARLGNAANVGVLDICDRLKQPLYELANLVGIDAAQQNNRESPGAGRGMPSTAKRGSESGRTPPSHESVAQEGRRSNTRY